MSNTLSWQNLNYSVGKTNYTVKWDPFRVAKETNLRRILNNVSGQIRTGDMVAIIGSSGAGKTSLMAALCQRIRGRIRGNFFVNDMPAKRNMISSVTGFVPQYETAVAVLTVTEHLHFVAELKLGRHMPKWEKRERVENVIKRLGMVNLKHTRVKHLSGGERKKLNLAEELIREPLFLFCDEPTTGLDAFNGKAVMQSLKLLTGSEDPDQSNQRAVICSIHQPSSEVFDYFNFIILMDCGEIVYHGRIAEFYPHLEKIGLSLPMNYNPAEFFVNLVSPITVQGVEHRERINLLCQLNKINLELELINALDAPKRSTSDIEEVEHLTWCMQIMVLLRRAALIGSRDIGESILHSSSHLLIALGIGVLYAGKSPNQQALISDVEGMFFNTIAEIFFYTYKRIVSVFEPELPIVRKETGENLYFISSYYIMKFLSLLPKIIVECIITSVFVYYISSFTRDFETFVDTTLTYIVLGLTSASYGFMWGCLFGDGLGGEMSTPIDLYQMIVGGIYINVGTLPVYFKYFSLFFYFSEAITHQYWAGITDIECVPNLPCLENGMEVLGKYSYGQTEDTVFIDYGCSLLWCILFHIIGYFALKRVVLKEGFY